MRSTWRTVAVALIAFVAAVAGVYCAQALGGKAPDGETELHALFHGELELTAEQEQKVEAIEGRFAARKKAMEAEMTGANAQLAAAIQAEHGYGPKVTAAVDHVHRVMGDMQKETLEHLFEMRRVLDDEQARQFDETVVEALTVEAR